MIEKRRPRRRKPRLNHKRSNFARPFENRGMSVPRSRGALSKVLEKYTNLAQDAVSNGDRVVAENYFQYAEHYQRVLNETNENSGSDTTEITNVTKTENNDFKPSRTERAINAQNERVEKNNSHEESKNKDVQKPESNEQKASKTFTSDGLEALKPFEI